MQKWKEKCGSRATYRNLAMSFYEAGKLRLIEAVCEDICSIGVPQHPVSISKKLWIIGSSQSCVLSLCILAVVTSMLMAYYTSQNDILLNWNSFLSTSTSMHVDNTLQSELGKSSYRHKAGEVAPNNLPQFSGPFVGRNTAIDNITHLFFHSPVQVVHIVGPPGVGKSTLAVHVGYKMATHGIAVQYINIDETRIFKTQGVSHSKLISTGTKGLIEWAKGLSIATLLILDNCDSLLQQENNGSVQVLNALSKASPHLHIMVTSSLRLNLLGVEPYYLKTLADESAIELLQLVSPIFTWNDSRTINEALADIMNALRSDMIDVLNKSSPSPHNLRPNIDYLDRKLHDLYFGMLYLISDPLVMTLNDGITIMKLLGGHPLALKIIGSLVKSPNLIIRELEENLIEESNPFEVRLKKDKMSPVLRLSYSSLDNSTQECALYLSHFPGSFSREAALNILSNCTNSTPIDCLGNLTNTSLLGTYIYAGQTRYQFHKVIKDYLLHIQSNGSQISIVKFNISFVLYYTKLLCCFVTIHNQTWHSKVNIGKVEYDSHNFEYLLETTSASLFNGQTYKFIADLIYAVNSNLMLEIFTTNEVLKMLQRMLTMFEDRMENISKEIGTLKTLNIHESLLLSLRKRFQDSGCEVASDLWQRLKDGQGPVNEACCKAVCVKTFPRQNYATWVKMLTKTNYSAYNYYSVYKELHFHFVGEPLCLMYCLFNVNIYVEWIWTVSMLMETLMTTTRELYSVRVILLQLAFLVCCQTAFFCGASSSAILSVYTVISLFLRHTHFPLLKRIKIKNIRMCIAVLYCIVLYVLVICAFHKANLVVTNFFFFCTLISHIGNLYSTSFGANILHLTSLIFVFNAYIYEFETMLYVSSCIVSFLYLWLHVLNFPVIIPVLVVLHCLRVILALIL